MINVVTSYLNGVVTVISQICNQYMSIWVIGIMKIKNSNIKHFIIDNINIYYLILIFLSFILNFFIVNDYNF